ncbi:MAG: helix-turn-helix transcriptional regulator, partial [Nitrospira sp.]|nr:helix-turn-helix transcriptional regulator [Nitrospira sp.]
MSIGPLIQAWRLSKKYSLESLSDLAHMSSALLEQIESEQTDPSAATVQALAAALRIPPAWLFDDPRSFDYLFHDAEDPEEPPPSLIDP